MDALALGTMQGMYSRTHTGQTGAIDNLRRLAVALRQRGVRSRPGYVQPSRVIEIIMDAIEQQAHAHIEHLNDPDSLAWHERLFTSPEDRHREAQAVQRALDGFPATRAKMREILAESSTRAEQSLARGGMGYRAALRYRGIGY
ncbi:hypothetical protein Rhopal_007371-T1 [Rhodotorula paludigena]|uniref:Uncharacterized protein n=1 Tax=Rhodotorula paludigena TaxID=86838 RepID=A0AAV5GZ64_9BASI|nr:hypothetical protein Rhopal_007371-T1 [Rhodotorula paludigena]